MGSSPGSGLGGGSLPRGSGSLVAGSSWVERWGTSPAEATPVRSYGGAAAGRRPQPQPGRRPSGAPAWMAGKTQLLLKAEATALHRAELTALGAIGHSSQLPGGSTPLDSPRPGSGPAFASQADVEAASREETVARTLRNLRKKVWPYHHH